MKDVFDCIVMGAAGRDFHDFARFLRDDPRFRVRCFTAHQIPFIERRSFPRELAGERYDADIPIHPEEELTDLIARYDADFVFLSYSDLSHADVMHRASIVQAAGASFVLLGPKHTQLRAEKPVIAVTAVRTGAGKSPISQALAAHLVGRGLRVGIMRHPMPYGDLRRQAVQRFDAIEDLDRHACTIEEREEYEPYLERGLSLFAGVDYAAILSAAEAQSDVLLWDGGNNDLPFVRPDLSIVVADALRPGHELAYYPGETGFRAADVIVISKVEQASREAVQAVRESAARVNPTAEIVEVDLVIEAGDDAPIRGRRALVVEDGPTLTHGGMAYGAGTLAARRAGAAELIDPRPHAVGSIARAFADYPHLERVLPALGYSEGQRLELAETIRRAAPDVVVDGSPARIGELLAIDAPVVGVRYRMEQRSGPSLTLLCDRLVDGDARPGKARPGGARS